MSDAAKFRLKAFHSPRYTADIGNHVMPIRKFDLVRAAIEEAKLPVDITEPPPATDEDIRGPLLCVARLDGQVIQPPLVAYDGCHRLAAWIAQQGRRPPYPITAHLILTQRQVPYWPIRR